MKLHRAVPALLAVTLAAGCLDGGGPTSPALEQRVLGVLGGLRVGETLTLAGAEASSLPIGGGGSAVEYVVVPFHASENGSAFLSFTLNGIGLDSAPSSAAESGTSAIDAAAWTRHEELHERLQREARPLLQRWGGRISPDRAASGNELGGTTAFVGQRVTLNANAIGPACTASSPRTGSVEAVTQRAIIVADTANPAGGFTRADYESFGAEFDRLVHPTITRYFGDPTDIDANGKVIIFFTRAVNELTGPGDTGFIAGFFWSRDLFTAAECAVSNEGEIFFVLVPDPNRVASPLAHTREGVFRSALGTIGHEYQHLINAGKRIYSTAADWEETWLDEGLSHIGEEALFYADSGLSPRSNIGTGSLPPPAVESINRFMVQNLLRYGLYLQKVTAESPIRPQDRLETRGATWSFLRYAADHSGRSDEDLFRALVGSSQSGFANLAGELEGAPMEWIRQWGVSAFSDDHVQAGAALLQQPSWNFRGLLPQLFDGRFPLDTRALGGSAALGLELRGGTSGYVRVRSEPGRVGRVTVTSGSGAPPATFRVTLLRVE